MKKLSFAVVALCIGVAASAFTVAPPPAGWYAQFDDTVDYTTPVTLTDVNLNCPVNPAHICAVQVKPDGSEEIRRSTDNYPN